MPEKYSDTVGGPSEAPGSPSAKRVFAIDSGSPVSSVALVWDGDLLTRQFTLGDSSKLLLPLLDELLAEVGGRLDQLDGLVGLRGPGSFTGLRVGLATLLGLHQALGIAAGTATTFEALAWQARRRTGAAQGPICAAVDALRGERFVQTFDGETLQPLGEPAIRPDHEIAGIETGTVIGFGWEGQTKETAESHKLLEAEPLAHDLAAIATQPGFAWEETELTQPLYFRPPAAAVQPGT